MKRHFWTRLISAVVTMAMAFSILAVPASAASADWTIQISVPSVGELYLTSKYVESIAGNKQEVTKVKNGLLEMGGKLYTGGVEFGAVVGWKAEGAQNITWFSLAELTASHPELDAQFKNIVEVGASSSSGSGSDSSSGSEATVSGGAGAALAIGGAAVVAVTGVYLYTHPEVVQQVKDFFHDFAANVQAKVQNLIPAHNVVEVPAGG